MSTEVKIETNSDAPKKDEPEKKVVETTETEQAVSTEPGAPVIKTVEKKEHTE